MKPIQRQNSDRTRPEIRGTGFSIQTVRYHAGTRQARHHHESSNATLVLGGSLEEDVGSARELAQPLSVVFKPAGTEHANRVGPHGAATLQIRFEGDFVDPDRSGVAESSWRWMHGGDVARRFIDVLRAWHERSDTTSLLEGSVYDLLGDVWSHHPEAHDVSRVAPGWLTVAVEELEDTFAAPRRVRDLAADAGVHPVALARAHRRHFGCSISDRVRRRRVAHAAGLIGAGMELGRVAFETGFSDQSHLTRTFKTETGATPGEYRGYLQEPATR